MAIRKATKQDICTMLRIYAPYVENTSVSFEYEIPTQAEFEARFREHIETYPWLVFEENGEVIGYAYAGRPFARMAYSWCAEISVYVSDACHGRGIGRALYAEVERILKMQGVEVVYAIITGENEASLRFHRALGYKHTAKYEKCGFKFGKWYDVYWLEKRLGGAGKPEKPPVSWNELELGID